MTKITTQNIFGFIACFVTLLLCIYILFIFSFCRIQWAVFLLRNREKLKTLWGIRLQYFFLGNNGVSDCQTFIKPEHYEFVPVFKAYAVHVREKLNKSDVAVSIMIIIAAIAFVGYKLTGH